MPAKRSTRKPKSSSMPIWKKVLWSLLGVGLLSGVLLAATLYQRLYKSNVSESVPGEVVYLEIPTGSTWPELLFLLQQQGLVRDMASFEWVAQRADYPNKVLPGRYRIEAGMNNLELVKLLASGRQEPVKIVINKFRNRFDLYGAVARKLEADSVRLARLFTDDKLMRKHGFNSENSLAMIVPNTYEFYWNTDAAEFLERMFTEYSKFWSAERREKSRRLGLSPEEVMVLASIVEEETNKNDEKGTVAQVYLNRLNMGMKLQADPTVKFAVGDFAIKRVTGKHLEVASPFNTYYVTGLPPAPICTPSIATIDAVLNSSPHDYLYFCAREDFSGYHRFARTYKEHQQNARLYQKALDKLNIKG
jgi:UPF0755 protein